jgi:uncharacterized ubiquitin-like protein YukD
MVDNESALNEGPGVRNKQLGSPNGLVKAEDRPYVKQPSNSYADYLNPGNDEKLSNLKDFAIKGKRKFSGSRNSTISTQEEPLIVLPIPGNRNDRPDFSIRNYLEHNKFQTNCYEKFLSQFMSERINKYNHHKSTQQHIEKLIENLLAKQKLTAANKEVQTIQIQQTQQIKSKNPKEIVQGPSQGELTFDNSFQGSGMPNTTKKNNMNSQNQLRNLKNNSQRILPDAVGNKLNDTLAHQKSFEEDEDDLDTLSLRPDEPPALTFGDKLASNRHAKTNRHMDEPEEFFKVPADLSNNAAIKAIAGFADHLKLVENANKNIFASQFSVKNKTDTHHILNPSTRESHLMLVLKPAALPTHLMIIGGIGSDIITDIDLYSLSKRRWESIRPELSNFPGATNFKIYGHRGDYFEGSVFIFGGYVSINHNFSKYLSNELFSLNVETMEIKRIPTSEGGRIPRPRVGHATAVYSNFMVVMGGRGENYNIRSDFWIIGLKLKPTARTTDKFGFTWAKLDIISRSGEYDEEYADLCYQTLTHIPKCKEAQGFANHVDCIITAVDSFWRIEFKPDRSK